MTNLIVLPLIIQSGLFTQSKEGNLIVDLTYSYEYDLVKLVVVAKKDTRNATVEVFMEITRGAPPEINPNLCISNCGVGLLLAIRLRSFYASVGCCISWL